jgi:ABC-type transport system involved in multi-copper enzyme maturation permease subunit
MRVLAIARNTYREAVRDKVFALVGAFGLLLAASSVILSPLTIGAQQKLVADLGLSSMTLFSVLVILFLGTGMVHKEIDKRTIMTILSKPLSRMEYLFGKYLGLLGTLLTMVAMMVALFAAALWLTGNPFLPAYWVSIGLSVCELMVVTAVVIFFSSFTTPVLTSLFTLGVFLSGRMLNDLQAFARVANDITVERTVTALKFVLPNLGLFDVRNAAVHGIPITHGHIVWAVVYMALYTLALLSLSDFIFRRREFQ